MKSLKKANLKGKRVLLRCDFNVPLSKKGEVLDDFRIEKTLPTIEYILRERGTVILMSHLGRPEPKGKMTFKNRKFSLKPVASFLEKKLSKKVVFIGDCIGPQTQKIIKELPENSVALLENLRFYKGEEANNLSFAKELAKLGDVFVNDAFGVSHRAHASVSGVTRYLPSFAGLLLEKEVKTLKGLMKSPEKPLVAIVGGAKVETKAALINKISEKADYVLIGGLIDREIREKDIYINYPRKLVVPVDEIDGKDIGPKTIKLFREKILSAKTVFFNGVVGQVENKKYTKGTEEILRAIIKSRAFSIIGGGDTVESLNCLKLGDKFDHISTGGGAMISFMAGEKLPGIDALK